VAFREWLPETTKNRLCSADRINEKCNLDSLKKIILKYSSIFSLLNWQQVCDISKKKFNFTKTQKKKKLPF
jgi:hypothetical protein